MRALGVAFVAGSLLVGVGCVRATSVRCADGSTCPDGHRCVPIASDSYACANGEQVTACAGLEPGATCMVDDDAGACIEDACVMPVCGDLIVHPLEACDDGDRENGDGCSSDCTSRELCGDGVVNLAEQCDSGVAGLSGDGCASTCVIEFPIWRNVDPGLPSPRIAHGLVSDPRGDGILMFGGSASLAFDPADTVSASFNDLWRWDGVTWSPVRTAAPAPPRAFAAMALDASRRRVVMFGGYNATRQATADLWEWDGVTWRRLVPASMSPSGRVGAGLACHAGRCVLYGGRSLAGELADLWEWDGAAWHLLGNGGANAPTKRLRPVLVHDPVRDVFVLHGGIQSASGGGTLHLGDTWELKIDNGPIWKSVLGVGPSARPAIGAFDASLGALVVAVDELAGANTTWRLAASGWTQLPGAVPTFSSFSEAAYDAGRGKLVLSRPTSVEELTANPSSGSWDTIDLEEPSIGDTYAAAYDPARGVVVAPTSTATWGWDGLGWRRLAPTSTPSATAPPRWPGLAYDAACDRMLRFGGNTQSMASAATAQLVGATWTELAPAASPPPRWHHAMAYDHARSVMVVFGGRDLAGPVAPDAWEWTGTSCATRSWVLVPAADRPPARERASLTYDARRGVMVLFGGSDGAEDLDDTWEWDGSTWTPRATSAKPPPRSAHGAVYDPRRERVVVFGGRNGDQLLDDLWEWDGDAGLWRALGAVVSPTPRAGVQLVPDVTGGLVAIGGGDASGPIERAVARLTSEQTVAPAETCSDAGEDPDQDLLAGCADPDCRSRCAPLCAPSIELAACPGPRCGDGMCTSLEDYLLCPQDCDPP